MASDTTHDCYRTPDPKLRYASVCEGPDRTTDNLAGAVRVQRAHARQAGVQRNQQVEALLLPHLADDDPGGPHPQRLLDQAPQRDLTGALEVGLTCLHRDDVGQRHLEFENLLAGHHPLPGRDGGAEAVEERHLYAPT
jgi:hypothetical protein